MPPTERPNIPAVSWLAKNLLDNRVGQVGLHQAIRELVVRSGSRYEISGLTPEIEEILRAKPAIVVCNHRYDAEHAALIASLPPRQDFYVIAAYGQLGLGENIAKHLIPVFISRHEQGPNAKLSVRIVRTMNISPRLGELEEAKRNVQSMKVAVQRVREGAMVVIFPEGPQGEGSWLPGVGHLIRGVGSEAGAYLEMVNIQGTSELDVARLIPFAGKLLPRIRVNYAFPIPMSEIIENRQVPREILEKLENRYKKWQGTL